jgi:LmbE family N-acetylglucosaminyl deacetylase
MTVNVLVEAIEQGVPLIVLSPHLDDAALSCGALMIHAARRTSVTVATFFTEAGQPPYTLSARRYLHQVGARSAQALFQQRQVEDRAALEPMGIKCVHIGLADALFRRRPHPEPQSLRGRLLPELTHVYPIYRVHITSGKIAAADVGTLRDVCDTVQLLAGSGPSLVLAPMGVGSHVDHVLVRSAAERSGARLVYYSDFPYNQRARLPESMIQRKGLMETQWCEVTLAKANLIQAYKTQVQALFQGGDIPLVPEVFFSMPADTERFGDAHEFLIGGNDSAVKGRNKW